MLGLGDELAQAWLVKQLRVILVTKPVACEGGTTLIPCLVCGRGGREVVLMQAGHQPVLLSLGKL